MRNLHLAIILIMVALVTLGATLVYEIPDTPADAMHQAEEVSVVDSYAFVYPSDGSLAKGNAIVSLGIDKNDFESSMGTSVIRSQSRVTDISDFVKPSDPFVKEIAATLMNLTPDGSDYVRATAALWFVQTAIAYETDIELYGQNEFVAYPVETLYLHRGDCEDQAVLLASIFEAMGLDCVLLDFDSHMAVAVDVGQGHGTTYTLGQRVYSACEATYDHAMPIGSFQTYGEPRIVDPDSHDSLRWTWNTVIAGYRSLIQRIVSI